MRKRIKSCFTKTDYTLNRVAKESFNGKDFIRRNNVVEVRKPAVDIWEENMPGRGKSICIGLAMGAILACSRKSQRANMAAKSGVVEKDLVGLAT